ncbi:colorectal cancer associated 2 [Aplochiton taeniatus]
MAARLYATPPNRVQRHEKQYALCFCQADKPKVYQGVRVKTTVKELLQQHRALQAAVKTIAIGALVNQDTNVPTMPSHYLDALPAGDLSSGAPASLHPRALFHEGACSVQQQENAYANQQLMDMILPDNSLNSNCSNSSGGFLPNSLSALPWSHGQPCSEIGYYNQGMAPSSPTDSLNLPSPVDYNSYSPPDSLSSSSSSSSCYDSPTRMDSGFHGFAPEAFHYQHCSLQHCYCLSHSWPVQQETVPTQEYAPYFGTTDYTYALPVEEGYYRRDLPITTDMCYL